MATRTRGPVDRKYITRPRTPIQKIRDIILVVFDLEQKDIALATGTDRGIVSNIFRDRHRSPDAEAAVIEYLNGRLPALSPDDRKLLRAIGVIPSNGVTISRDVMGWALPSGG